MICLTFSSTPDAMRLSCDAQFTLMLKSGGGK
jgi:hypothetical protein